MPRSETRPSKLRFLAFSLVPLLVFLGLGELAARRFWHTAPPGDDNLPSHPTRLWVLPESTTMLVGPHQVQTAENGLRFVPLTGAEHRILTLGDSNIFGYDLGHPDTLHGRLQQTFEQWGMHVDVLCGGVFGYSTVQSLALLQEVGFGMEPDLLVVGNLLSDEYPDALTDLERIAGRETAWSRFEWTFLRWSVGWKFVRLRFLESEAAEHVIRGAVGRLGQADPRVPVADYEANLVQICELAAERDVGVVFYQPPTHDRMTGRIEDSEHVLAQRRAAERCGVPLVVGLAALKLDEIPIDQAFLDDVHATAVTNQAVARHLARVLTEAGWPEQRLVPVTE